MRAPEALEANDPTYEGLKESYAAQYPFATFGEAQWHEIKKSLAARGVDLNVQMVDELYGPREWWGWDDYNAPYIMCCKKWLITLRCYAG